MLPASMLTRADELARMTVLDASRTAIVLGTLWAERPAVLVFVRHFGCIHCRAHVIDLVRRIDLVRKAGAELVIVGSGTPNFIAGFRDETGWDGPVYVDPSLEVYKAAQLERGVLKTFSPLAIGKTIGAFASGVRQGRTQGDPWQQGGTLVIAPDHAVLWHHVSKRSGDNARPEDIAAALARHAA
jgi:peroxiredoxin